MSTSRMFIIASAVLALCAREAFGDENPCPDPGCHVKNGGVLATPKGTVLLLPPGYYLDEPTWKRRDDELKLAQELNTRLKAENESFRQSADEIHWKVPIVAAGLGFVAGIVVMLMK